MKSCNILRLICQQAKNLYVRQALLFAASEPLQPSVLLADMVTSGMTGHELAAAVRRYRPALPAVLFTGKVFDRGPRSESMGFWYVNKRHGPGALLSAIREAIRATARGLAAVSQEKGR